MATYTVDQVISGSPDLDVGDDVYAKPMPLVSSPWLDDNLLAEPTVGTTIYTIAAAGLDTTITYIVHRNDYSSTFTTDYGSDANKLTASAITSTDADTRVYFKGPSLPSGLTAGQPYWVINLVDGVSFEVEAIQSSGTPVDLLDDGTGSLTFTLASRRSSSDTEVGPIQADQSALVAEGELTSIAAQITLTYADTQYIRGVVDTLNATLTGGNAAAVIEATNIYAAVGSTKSVSVTCVEDISAKTLVIAFETIPATADVATIADGSITKASSVATFSLPAATTTVERTLRYAIRDTTTAQEYGSGYVFVTYGAASD